MYTNTHCLLLHTKDLCVHHMYIHIHVELHRITYSCVHISIHVCIYIYIIYIRVEIRMVDIQVPYNDPTANCDASLRGSYTQAASAAAAAYLCTLPTPLEGPLQSRLVVGVIVNSIEATGSKQIGPKPIPILGPIPTLAYMPSTLGCCLHDVSVVHFLSNAVFASRHQFRDPSLAHAALYLHEG